MKIKKIQGYGAIVGTSMLNKTIVTGCYYLEGSCEKGINNEEDIEDKVIKKKDEDMKKEEFVNLLNEGSKSTVWKKDENNSNKGYPIFK